jgi:hypothetical protein
MKNQGEKKQHYGSGDGGRGDAEIGRDGEPITTRNSTDHIRPASSLGQYRSGSVSDRIQLSLRLGPDLGINAHYAVANAPVPYWTERSVLETVRHD